MCIITILFKNNKFYFLFNMINKILILAENVADKYKISREHQDKYALESQKRAADAQNNGIFKDEIIPIEIKTRRNTIVFDTDEYPKHNTTLESLSALKPVFKQVRHFSKNFMKIKIKYFIIYIYI